jgi:hypothetical protein
MLKDINTGKMLNNKVIVDNQSFVPLNNTHITICNNDYQVIKNISDIYNNPSVVEEFNKEALKKEAFKKEAFKKEAFKIMVKIMSKGFENAFNDFKETTIGLLQLKIKKCRIECIKNSLLVNNQKLLLKQQ